MIKNYISKFNEQESHIRKLLYEGEKIVHCTDDISFNGRFYKPNWVATSMGRVYSLFKRDWMIIKPWKNSKNKTPYYILSNGMLAHALTANYFCNKKIIELYGEDAVEVHHKKSFDESKGLIENNSASNLNYVKKETHRATIDAIQHGRKHKNIELSSDMQVISNTLRYHDGSSIWCDINENDEEEIKVHIPIKSRIATEEWKTIEESGKKVGYELKDIKTININENGSLTIKYEDNESYLFDKKNNSFKKVE